jgi:hypothetical protein
VNTNITAVALEPISMDESRHLIRLEGIVEKWLGTFVEVGEALAEIHDRKLYRTAHATFAESCRVKWKISDRRARQLMDAAEVTSTIAKSGTTVPKSERQARPLAALPVAQRAKAWQKAVASSPNGQPTAKAVQVVVETMNPQPPKTVRVMVWKHIDDDPNATRTPLHQITQVITQLWPHLNGDDRNLLGNFIAGLRGGT